MKQRPNLQNGIHEALKGESCIGQTHAHDPRRERAQGAPELGLVDIFIRHMHLKISPLQIKLGEKGASSQFVNYHGWDIGL
jgi:hypothetical protein